MSRTKAQRAEQAEAIAQLREWIKPGDTVYTVLEHVSRSGMQREIRVVLPTVEIPGTPHSAGYKIIDEAARPRVDFLHPNHAIATALGMRQGKRDGLIVGGCGMDMGFHVVYELSSVLYGARRVQLPEGETWVPDTPWDSHPGKGYAWMGGYRCLGKGQCPSNYHSNHRDRVRCEGTRVYNPEGPDTGHYCYAPSAWNRAEPSEEWPRRMVDIGEGQTIAAGYLACIVYEKDEAIPVGTKDLIIREDGSALQVCPTCKGVGDLPNPEGPERFDLLHTDGYAVRHKWL